MPLRESLEYPATRRVDVVDVLHGEPIADPYRWLEDTAAPEVGEWIATQNALTEAVLAASPRRDEFRRRLTEVWDYPRLGVPHERGGRWFQLRNSGLQAQSVLYVMADPDDAGRVLLDPNTMSADGTVALSSYAVSPDGKLCAYGMASAGSDWMTWRIRDIDSGDDVDDVLEWSKFSGVVWTPDSTELLYAVLDAPEPGREHLAESRVARLARHRLGTAQTADRTFWSEPDEPELLPSLLPCDDDEYAVIVVNRGTFPENQLHVLDLRDRDADVRPLVPDLTCKAELVGNVGSTFYVLTDADAELHRVVAIDLDRPAREEWRTVVPESDDVLVEARLYGGCIVAHYLEHASSRLRKFSLDGTPLGEVELPGLVTVAELSGHADHDDVHLSLTSFTDSGSLWRHDVRTGETRMRHAASARIDVEQFVTDQVFVASADGTKIPVFLVHRADVVPNGDVPVLLYGYGGFTIPLTPAFAVTRAVWVERGGLYAVANLRGGGEYGRAWHDGGRLAHKQNVFDDFTAVARWLGGDSGWSRPGRVGIHGGSNGGLLVGACLTQHPEVFGAAAPAVGVLDMLRFHLFTIGWAWASDYGHPDDPEHFRWLRAYSPLHNISPGREYPPTLVLTGDHDDRVAPGHSFKFAAALQTAQGGEAPVLLRVETSAGHGAGKPTTKLIEEGADLLAFFAETVGAGVMTGDAV